MSSWPLSQPSSSTSRTSRSRRCQPSSLHGGGLLATPGLYAASSSTRERIPKGPNPIGTSSSSTLTPLPRQSPDGPLSQKVSSKRVPPKEALRREKDPQHFTRGGLRRNPSGSTTSGPSSSLVPTSSQQSVDVHPYSRHALVVESGERGESHPSDRSNDRDGTVPVAVAVAAVDVAVASVAAPPPLPAGVPDHCSVHGILFCPQSLLQPLRSLCGKILDELVSHLDNRDPRRSKISARALMAIPMFIHVAKGGGSARRRVKSSLDDLNNLDDVSAGVLLEHNTRRSAYFRDRNTNVARRGERGLFPTRRVSQLVRTGCLSKALKMVESFVERESGGGIVEQSDEVLQQLRDLHPLRSDRDLLPVGVPADAVPLTLTGDDISNGLRNLPRQSAGAFSGFTFELLKLLLEGENGATRRDLVARLFNHMLAGTAGDASIWTVSRLIPLRKPNGGIRPISIGVSVVAVAG